MLDKIMKKDQFALFKIPPFDLINWENNKVTELPIISIIDQLMKKY